ncbi:nuclear transport factor 2 family protein [Sulfitobacter sp.]|uniref:nuclear transport factor 2 family protein n=1 Tax=Sulfitobacter sp. TaxID=1903071 RepID=UPI003EFB2D47
MSNAVSIQQCLANWHQIVANGNQSEELDAILHEDAVFHSPVVHTPQRGRKIVNAYLSAAGVTLGNDSFRYLRELASDDTVLLEFETTMEGILVNGVDIITFDSDGLITDFKVMVRPLKAVNKVWEMMGAQLERTRGA